MIRPSDLKLRLGIILALTVISVLLFVPVDKKERTAGPFRINLGLDLKGGTYVLLRADTASVAPSHVSDAIQGAIEKVRNRIDTYGVKETSIQMQGTNAILVQLPGMVERELINKLREVGKLEFKLVEADKEKNENALKGNVPEGYELKVFERTSLLLHKEVSVSGADLKESSIGFDNALPVVRLKFTSEGAKKFARVTEENVNKFLAIILDEKVISAPRIDEPILSGEGIIRGDFSLDEVRMLTSVLNSGALPIPLYVEEERSVGPLLGSDSIRRGINATLLGILLVAIFMLLYYSLGGVIAIICLILDAVFILGGLNLLKGTLTLPGIAGIILTLGMAVDANVLIYERIREELAAKKPLSLAVKNSFEKTSITIFDANITTLIAALFLFVFGTGPIRGFATTLSLGLFISMFTAIYVGKTIFALLLKRRLERFPMLQLFPSSKLNFLKPRFFCLFISLVLIAVGMSHFFSRRDTIYGIDFKGGQVMEYKLTPAVPIESVRATLREKGFPDLVIQDFNDIAGGIIIKSKSDVVDTIEPVLKDVFKNVERLKTTKVGPTVGALLKKKAFSAVFLSLVGILAYVFFRFKHFDFALAGVIALFHDCLIALGFVALFAYEVDLLIITALLTIAGYSINDTIVIYDRIREIAPRLTKASLPEIINSALNSTFSRTIITSFATLLVVVAMHLLGGEALRGFSFALLVGFIAGVYSTIYIASALVILFRRARV